MHVQSILERKGTDVVTIDAEKSVLQAAELMNQRRIGAVVVTHKNLVVETGNQAAATTPGRGFVPLDPGDTSKAKLKSLLEALNALRVPTADVIDIIKGLDRNGKLHARLIIE